MAFKATGKTVGAAGVVLLAGLLLGGCANTNNRDEDSRGASLLILESLTGAAGEDFGGTGDTVLFSDVYTCTDATHDECSIFSDTGFATLANRPLNEGPFGAEGGIWQDINMYRLRVVYTRADGRNTEGVDVPWAFDSVMASYVELDSSVTVPFVIVRHVAKMERPLVDLIGVGDEVIISTNTRCDFWGRDVAGNEHHVYGFIDIEFGDYGP